ncbi:translation initiation factor IF-2-like [Pipistrellus kuhlii]|uniref:translation initiation factor IF-2-like n=1 Tax=Pipistrellus kuhlii TaxID=59472 RepID=UPI001E26EDE1|nr:translation initiation factor IF-2-like [Pipistrellus kuhlii]
MYSSKQEETQSSSFRPGFLRPGPREGAGTTPPGGRARGACAVSARCGGRPLRTRPAAAPTRRSFKSCPGAEGRAERRGGRHGTEERELPGWGAGLLRSDSRAFPGEAGKPSVPSADGCCRERRPSFRSPRAEEPAACGPAMPAPRQAGPRGGAFPRRCRLPGVRSPAPLLPVRPRTGVPLALRPPRLPARQSLQVVLLQGGW